MGLFSSKNLDSLETLLIDQIEDLYDAEQRIAQALPKMAELAHCAPLKAAFEQHVRETQNHIGRLEQVFQLLGREPSRHTCYAVKGLIEEGQEVLSATGDECVIDAALIAAAQRTEHYEIAAYEGLITMADAMGEAKVSELLTENLEQERKALTKMKTIGKRLANDSAKASV